MTRYPLTWPAGWKRTPSHARKRAQFGKMQRTDLSWKTKAEVTIAEGTKRVLAQLQLMGVTEDDVLISTNVKLRIDGLPRSDQRMPDDPGVAVYWQRAGRDKQHKVIATDQYDRVADNLAAIAASLEAMRAIERHGGAVILERAFMGFEALPSPNDWRHVMGFEQTPSYTDAKNRYLVLARSRHPDAGGSETAMKELNAAWESAQRELQP